VIFDRSWYNRAGVAHVMGFCTEDEYWDFLRACPEFERLLVQGGIRLIKYSLSVSDEEQERRFQQRAGDPAKLWKLSPMDLLSRDRWVEYSKAKDAEAACACYDDYHRPPGAAPRSSRTTTPNSPEATRIGSGTPRPSGTYSRRNTGCRLASASNA
jgi:hypothetical protein